jgi:hypothetical protein
VRNLPGRIPTGTALIGVRESATMSEVKVARVVILSW